MIYTEPKKDWKYGDKVRCLGFYATRGIAEVIGYKPDWTAITVRFKDGTKAHVSNTALEIRQVFATDQNIAKLFKQKVIS